MGTPLTKQAVADLYFLEHRAKVLDLAAFLDRFDRASEPGGGDFRVQALTAALGLVLDGQPDRARRVLELWSDRSTEPIERAPMKGALGAMPIEAGERR
jgi:hypothetical protein